MTEELVSYGRIQQAILLVRGQKVMLDRDLASLYEVETRALNQAVKRNRERFPADFMLELTRDEIIRISQTVTSFVSCCPKEGRGKRIAMLDTDTKRPMTPRVCPRRSSLRTDLRTGRQTALREMSVRTLDRALDALEGKTTPAKPKPAAAVVVLSGETR